MIWILICFVCTNIVADIHVLIVAYPVNHASIRAGDMPNPQKLTVKKSSANIGLSENG